MTSICWFFEVKCSVLLLKPQGQTRFRPISGICCNFIFQVVILCCLFVQDFRSPCHSTPPTRRNPEDKLQTRTNTHINRDRSTTNFLLTCDLKVSNCSQSLLRLSWHLTFKAPDQFNIWKWRTLYWRNNLWSTTSCSASVMTLRPNVTWEWLWERGANCSGFNSWSRDKMKRIYEPELSKTDFCLPRASAAS